MLTRRQLLRRGVGGAAALVFPAGCARDPRKHGLLVNDVHSQLNETRVRGIERPESLAGLADVVRAARRDQHALCIAGGRHAMGGQQFASDAVMIDVNGLDQVFELDLERGQIEVGAGIQWPALIEHLQGAQADATRPWGIIQKQTGADRLSLGGALAANAHGRGLELRPMIGDVEAFTLVDARGELVRCSRSEHAELFRLAIGGYGLFGPIASVRLRLARRRKLRRVVEVIELADLPAAFERRIADGFLFGDFQYSTDLASEQGLRLGVFSCYQPVDDATPVPAQQAQLSEADWRELIYLGHVDRARAWAAYSSYYLSTSGQVYASDLHQRSTYVDDYHQQLASRLGPRARGSEMISEIYVPRDALVRFMESVRRDLTRSGADLIYGTIRLIERDDESLLAWAREPWACVIFNLHVAHDADGIARATRDFQRLIDRGLELGGSYFLTYHRWARRDQVAAAHPRLVEFLRAKQRADPQELFQSDWYRHYREMFESEIGRAPRIIAP
jgi:FAD/FMN-containing dehydrogenase